MPAMPGMGAIVPAIHEEGQPGYYGMVLNFPHGGEYQANLSIRTQGGETATVTKIVVHPGWQWAAGAPARPVDDVALLQLDHPVNLQPIQLAGHAARHCSGNAGKRVRQTACHALK